MTRSTHIQEALAREGVCVLCRVFGAVEMARVSASLDRMIAAPDVRGGPWKYCDDEARDRGQWILSRLERLTEHDDAIAALVRGSMREIASDGLGEEAVLFKDKANLKLPGTGAFAAHQDAQAGWSMYAPLHMTVMVSVDRTTRENGCIEFSKGPRRTTLAGSEWEPLRDDDFVFESIETAPGDVVVFDSFAVHRSAPNRTDSPRRVLYATYNAARYGDAYERYFADKLRAYPPEAEREAGVSYRYRV